MPSMSVTPQSVPPMNTLGAEVVSRSLSQLWRSPKESPPAPVAIYTASNSASSSRVFISVPIAEFRLDGGKLQGYIRIEFGKAGMGAERAAPAGFLFEHRDREFFLGEIQRAGKAGNACTDDGDALVFGWYDVGFRLAVFRISEAGGFKIAQGYRFVAEQCALAVGSAGLIAEGADDSGKNGGIPQSLVSCQPSALCPPFPERNGYPCGKDRRRNRRRALRENICAVYAVASSSFIRHSSSYRNHAKTRNRHGFH